MFPQLNLLLLIAWHYQHLLGQCLVWDDDPREITVQKDLNSDLMFSFWNDLGYSQSGGSPLTHGSAMEVVSQRNNDRRQFSLVVQNLVRLGLVSEEIRRNVNGAENPFLQSWDSATGRNTPHNSELRFYLTLLGYEFVVACSRPSQKASNSEPSDGLH